MSAHGASIELISRLVGHTTTATTETVYRHKLRPVIREGAEIIGKVLAPKSVARKYLAFSAYRLLIPGLEAYVTMKRDERPCYGARKAADSQVHSLPRQQSDV